MKDELARKNLISDKSTFSWTKMKSSQSINDYEIDLNKIIWSLSSIIFNVKFVSNIERKLSYRTFSCKHNRFFHYHSIFNVHFHDRNSWNIFNSEKRVSNLKNIFIPQRKCQYQYDLFIHITWKYYHLTFVFFMMSTMSRACWRYYESLSPINWFEINFKWKISMGQQMYVGNKYFDHQFNLWNRYLDIYDCPLFFIQRNITCTSKISEIFDN